MDDEVGRSGDGMAPAEAGAPTAGDLVTAVVTGDTPDEAVEAAIATLHDYERAGFELVDYAWRPQAGLRAATADMTFRATRTWATPPTPRESTRAAYEHPARDARNEWIAITVVLLLVIAMFFGWRIWSMAHQYDDLCSIPGMAAEYPDICD